MSTLVPPKILLLDEHTAALDPSTAENVMDITKQIVRQNHITTMMITHNMHQALVTGNRTIMLDEGSIILDFPEEKRGGMTVEDLVDLFSKRKKEEFANDKMLLS